ncbi:hypothetical protein EK21DRAFT_85418 [Setomelanomma holmii]|uniref:Uncharacterized protein n=1 Tax=Setomelanomma holmii TaxID=210430 RepID=A0A9P4HJI3_9PLEO|nr:hypothetical protein EK21DRAFT_85418 [Setomelanomma holmii]
MSSTQPALPTAWLAPPEGLLASNHPVQIAPVPLAISVTLAFLVSAAMIFLFSQNRVVFLQDKIIRPEENVAQPTAAEPRRLRTEPIQNIEIPRVVHPTSTPDKLVTRHVGFDPGLKADNLLGMDGNARQEYPRPNSRAGRNVKRRDCATPSHLDYDSDAETLNDFDRNSAVWPLSRSEASDAEALELRRSRLYDRDSIRRSRFSLADNKRLGDAY